MSHTTTAAILAHHSSHNQASNRRIELEGYAFVHFEDEHDAEDAIHALDNSPFGYDKRRLSVEWARFETQEEATKALECTHMSKILDRVVSVESRSPYRRDRPSPDYGRARSPVYAGLLYADQDLLYEDQELERL
ncbi:serine/arginine-rich splicing factor RS31 isoform X2 [Tanacetum coccineum]